MAGGEPARAESGILYLVPTPLGNLRDITLRAMDIFSSAQIIAAEDTRRTGQLLKLHNIERLGRFVSYHEHNEARRTTELVGALLQGNSVALASNAGMPSVSDPGYRLVKAAIEKGIRVEALPGASTPVVALAASGLPTDSFAFLGFAPRKQGARKRFLEEAAARRETVLLFESPERLLRTLKEALEAFGPGRRCAVCREISKLHEEYHRGTLEELVAIFSERAPRGEICLVFEGWREKGRGKPQK